MLSKVESVKIKELNDGFTYIFDFDGGESVVSAYEQFMIGNLLPAQEMALLPYSYVEKVSTYNKEVIARERNVKLGLPMVATYSWKKSESYNKENTITHENGNKSIQEYGITMKQQKGRFFHMHKEWIRSFYGGISETFNKSGKMIEKTVSGQFLMKFENDHGKTWKFRSALKKFNKELGLRNYIDLKMDEKEKIGYFKLQFGFNIPETLTKILINQAKNKTFDSNSQSTLRKVIADYFTNGDKDSLCNQENESLTQCQRRLVRKSAKALEKMNIQLKKMETSLRNSRREFVTNYAKFGNGLLRNQFIVETLGRMDRTCLMKYELIAEGMMFKKVTKTGFVNRSCN